MVISRADRGKRDPGKKDQVEPALASIDEPSAPTKNGNNSPGAHEQEWKIRNRVAGIGNAAKLALVGKIMVRQRLRNRPHQRQPQSAQSSNAEHNQHPRAKRSIPKW